MHCISLLRKCKRGQLSGIYWNALQLLVQSEPLQCLTAMHHQRWEFRYPDWEFRYPDGTGWLATFHPPDHYLISACMGRVRPSIPALITLVWGLCASHLRARRGRRPKKEIGFPPRNLTISNSHNRQSILTQSCQPVCVISYFTVWIKRSGFTSLTTYIF